MDISFNFSAIQQAGGNPFLIIWMLISSGGWVVFLIFFLWALTQFWLAYIRSQRRKTWKYILLAIDVPKDNEQTPRAVENIFQHLAGVHETYDFIEKWWNGGIQRAFSFEIISLEGYIQFLIHTEVTFRDLVEAAIYAQYPDAEIVEVEDYTKDWNITFPHPEYDLWGTEIKMPKKHFYPIKTHPAFDDSISQEHKDPMAGLLEALGRIGPGEQMWVQFVLHAADNDWGDGAHNLIQKLIGGKVKEKFTLLDLIFEIPNKAVSFISEALSPPVESSSSNIQDPPNKILYLTQDQKDVVDLIEKKIAKLGFHVRLRLIYIAKKEVFDKTKGSKVLYGSLKQYNTLNANAFKPNARYWTGAIHFMSKQRLIWRKNKILRFFRDRGHSLASDDFGFILNTEELASVWHFPSIIVKAPMIKKTDAKKAEPPLSLPVEGGFSQQGQTTEQKEEATQAKKAEFPDNLPTV